MRHTVLPLSPGAALTACSAGFDNPRKSTFTTVRELLENSLDAAEEGGVLPEVRIEVEQVPLAEARPSLYGRGAEAEVGGKGDSQ